MTEVVASLQIVAAVCFLAAGVVVLWSPQRDQRVAPTVLAALCLLLAAICSINALGSMGWLRSLEAYEGYVEILVFPLFLFWVYARRSVEHRRVVQSMHEEQRMRAALLDLMEEAVIVRSPQGSVLFANVAAEQLLGDQLHRAGPTPWSAVDGAAEVVAGDGSAVPLMVRKGDIEFGGSAAVLNVLTDLTQQKQAEAEREQMLLRLQRAEKDKALASLTGGIAHDFNNLLVPILGYADELRSEASAGSEEEAAASEILAAGKRAVDLIKQIRAFSLGKEESRGPTKLQTLLDEVLKLQARVLPSSIELSAEISPTCPPVVTSAGDFHRACVNLITNAQQAIGDRAGSISVRLASRPTDEGQEVVLSVSDTGCGIPDDVRGRIFDPYFTTRQDQGGTGLGLSLVLGAVRASGGRMELESAEGVGTTIRVLLPPAPYSEGEGELAAPADVTSGASAHVLAVDDDVAVLNLIARTLRRAGHRVSAFDDSTLALEAFSAAPERFDVVLSDITMPRLTGDVLMERVRALAPETPVILATGRTSRLSLQEARELGCAALLTKPFLPSVLTMTVARVLEAG